MDIVIVANFCGDFSETDNGRFLYIARMLSQHHDVEIVTSSFFHATKKKREKAISIETISVSLIHEPGYSKNISAKRYISHHIWGNNVMDYLKKRKKPDAIYCAIPSLSAASKCAKFCEKNGIRFVIDIQDLWPEAFKMVIKAPVISDIMFAPFTILSNGIYKRADDIVAVSNTYVSRAAKVNTKSGNMHPIYLGTDLDVVDAAIHGSTYRVDKNASEFWIGYAGALERSYDLNSVIKAIQLTKQNSELNIVLIVMGEGSRKEEFVECANDCGIKAHFLGRLYYDDMCKVLSNCDIVVNPITKGSAASIINKVGDYAAVGKAVVNTQESKEYCALVEAYQMGINCKNNDPSSLAKAFVSLLNNKEKLLEMGKNARRCAEERFDRKKTYQAIWDMFKG